MFATTTLLTVRVVGNTLAQYRRVNQHYEQTLAQIVERSGDDDGANTGLIIGAGTAAALVVAGGVIGLRNRQKS